MKTFAKIVACMVCLIALLAVSCGSPPSNETSFVNDDVGAENKFIGVWRPAELVETDLDIQEMANDQPDFYMVFTEKYKFVVGSRNPNRQELPENPTDSQLAAAWAPVYAFAWTYEVKGNTVIEHLLFSKNPNEKQGEQGSHTFKFDGDDLIWTIEGVNRGRNTVTARFRRLE